MKTTSFEQIKAILHSIGKALKNGLAGARMLAVNAQKTADEAKEKASTVDGKMDANNPVGTGSFSMGRKPGSKVGEKSHTEGNYNEASGQISHAEGGGTTASGYFSHAEGRYTVASGSYSHAEGYKTEAASEAQHVQGYLNKVDNKKLYLHIVGNGKENGSDTPTRSNAHTLDWDGNAWYAGCVECTGVLLKSPNGTKYKLSVDNQGNLSADALS